MNWKSPNVACLADVLNERQTPYSNIFGLVVDRNSVVIEFLFVQSPLYSAQSPLYSVQSLLYSAHMNMSNPTNIADTLTGFVRYAQAVI